MSSQLVPLILFGIATAFSPGPNNIMLTASGISFGLKRTIPHILGIPFGFGIQLALCAYGLGAILLYVPEANVALKLFSSGYLLYLAWMLRVNVVGSTGSDSSGKPMSFFNAALFQFANPKAWIMAVTGASVFLPPYEPFILSVSILCLVFCLINLPCVGVWAILGSAIKAHLSNPVWQKWFSGIIVVLTLYTAVAVWL